MLQPDYVFYILLHNAITLILSKAADNQQKEYILLTGSEEWNKNWKNLFYNIACSVVHLYYQQHEPLLTVLQIIQIMMKN